MSNRLTTLFETKRKAGEKVVSVYLTAGFPKLEDTVSIVVALEEAGVDLVEIGFPFSDSLVDGPTIQRSNAVALENGMSLSLLFGQLGALREKVTIPVLLMGSLNPVLQLGVERFVKGCTTVGVDAVILPDLPLTEYHAYRPIFEKGGVGPIFLVTPQTEKHRVREIDKVSGGFIYLVSSYGVTGGHLKEGAFCQDHLKEMAELGLKNPLLVGFGISDRESFDLATAHVDGGIIGSAFIRALEKDPDIQNAINTFVPQFIRKGSS